MLATNHLLNMYKTLIFIFIGICSCFATQAQSQAIIDSLLEVTGTDISVQKKVDSFVKLAQEYRDSDSTNAVKYANKAIKIAKEIAYKEGEIDAIFIIAWVHALLGHLSTAEELFTKNIAESELADYHIGKIRSLNALGYIHTRKGIYQKALELYLEALLIAEGDENKKMMMTCYQYIGNVYTNQEAYTKALDYHFKSLKIREECGDKSSLANEYSNIGIIYDLQGNYDKALEYYNLSLAIRKELKNSFGVASDYNNLGMLYKSKGDFTKALEYASMSYDIFYKSGISAYYSYPMLTIGEIYLAQDEWRLAKSYFEKGLSISQSIGNKPNIKLAAEGLATLEKELGNYKKAYEYHVLFKQIEDSLKSEKQIEKFTRLEMNYKFQQEKDSIQFASDKQRFVLEKDIQKRKLTQNTTFIILGFSILVLIILFLYLNYKIRANKALTAKSEELKAINEEVKQQAQEIAQLNKALEKNLDQTTQNLIVKNEKLTEYAYYNSHETRAPLARLLGLIQIIDFAESDAERDFILEKIKENSKELDEIINKMNHVLRDSDVFK